MGYYINNIGTTFKEKVDNLVRDYNAEIIPEPTEFKDNLVCVVNNGLFAAAGYTYDQMEMDEFKSPDPRPKKWLIVPNADKLSGYKK